MSLDDLINNKKFAFVAVHRHGWILQYVNQPLRKDKEAILAAVKQHRRALRYVVRLWKGCRYYISRKKEHGWDLDAAHKFIWGDRLCFE